MSPYIWIVTGVVATRVLTTREKEILDLICRGYRTREIAAALTTITVSA
ncbi:LuxR C-terminal-related transcriptional regulator [Rhizobium sp. NPDC090279]